MKRILALALGIFSVNCRFLRRFNIDNEKYNNFQLTLNESPLNISLFLLNFIIARECFSCSSIIGILYYLITITVDFATSAEELYTVYAQLHKFILLFMFHFKRFKLAFLSKIFNY